MLFSRQLSLRDLMGLSRALRHNIASGLSVLDVFRQQSERGARRVRPVAARVAASLAEGSSLSAALKRNSESFPPLFLSLVRVGEETGHMPEVFKELEEYFALEQKLRRQFIAQSFLPVAQFFFAVFLIAGLIWVLGMVSPTKPISVFGFTKGQGALQFLGYVFGPLTLMVGFYVLFRRRLRGTAAVEGALLRVPVLGPCLKAIAMSRLCLALQLTLDSGMTIMNAVRLSLEATGNIAFGSYAESVAAALKKQKPLSVALEPMRVLPRDFVDLVATAEQGGRVPEVMRSQAVYYQEEASRRMTALTRLASGFLYLVYAGCVIWAIFSLAQIYFSGFKDLK